MHKDTVSDLETFLTQKIQKLEELQRAVSVISNLQADIAALQRILADFKGETTPQGTLTYSVTRATHADHITQESTPRLVESILREAGKPLTGDQIMQVIEAKGRHTKKANVISAIYHNIKRGRLFRLVAPGTFALLEWSDQMGNRSSTFRAQ